MNPDTNAAKRPVLRKPEPDVVAKLRELFPKGAPRLDYREMTLAAAERTDDAGDTEARVADSNPVIPISLSSEAPVLRYDWWDDEYYYEVLDHSPSSVVMDYARDGLPFVASHRAFDANAQHGLIENVRVEKKVLRGDVRMSRAVRSQEIAQDMRDGIRKKVSVGYIIGDEFEQTEKAKDGIPIRRFLSWMPIEGSTVPIPADYNVGIERATSPECQAAFARFLTLHPGNHTGQPTAGARGASQPNEGSPHLTPTPAAAKAKERTMEGDNAAPGGTANTNTQANANVDATSGNRGTTPQVTVTASHERNAEMERISNIRAWGRDHAIEPERIQKWIGDGTSQLDASREISNILQERMAKPIQTVGGPQLSEKDQKRFSFARALMLGTPLQEECSKQPGGSKIDFGFERELLAEVQRTTAAQRNGNVLPFTLFARMLPNQTRTGIDSATASTGGSFKFTQPGDFIPILRNKTSIMRAGATILTGLTGPVTFPKQNGTMSTVYSAENPGSDISITNLTTTTLTLAFKSLGAATAFSRQALFSAASGNNDLEAIVQSDMGAVVGLAIDLGALNGSGATNNPRGLLKNTNIGSVLAGNGTNGGTATWNTYVDLETAIADANADTNRMAYITNTKQRGVAKKIAVLGNTASGVPVWSGTPGEMDGEVNGYRAIVSNQVPRNLTKGSDTTACSAIVFGAFEHQLVGMFGNGFETIVDPYSKKFQGMVEVAAWVFFDANQRYDEAFAAVQDAK